MAKTGTCFLLSINREEVWKVNSAVAEDNCGKEKHMEIVNYLKSEHEMGHGHANALVHWTLQGNKAK